jgi:heat shock protein HslJ
MAGTLSGTVVQRASLEPLAGVEIRIRFVGWRSQERRTSSDANGSFLLSDVPIGEWMVEYPVPGGDHRTLKATVLDRATTVLDIELDTLPAPPIPESILKATWRVAEINSVAFPQRTVLHFGKDGRVEGDGPCNIFSARFAAHWPDLEFKGLTATEMACAEIAAETAFFAALSRVDRAVFLSDREFLLTGPDSVCLRLVPLDNGPGDAVPDSQAIGRQSSGGAGSLQSQEEEDSAGEVGNDSPTNSDPRDNGSGSGSGEVMGKVVYKQARAPVPDAAVTILQSPGSFPDMASLTSLDGTFRLGGLPSGDYILQATGPNGMAGSADVLVEAGRVCACLIVIS